MNLRQLRYFVKVVEAGNMTRAAESLHVAQPALGMQIRQLEEDLGVALLVRHSRGVDATAAGKLLHDRALEILALVSETRKEISSAKFERGESIRLGLTPMLMLVLGPDLAINVRDTLPQVFLSLVEAMSHILVEALLRDEVDLALAYDVPDHPQLHRVELLHEDLVLVTLPGTHVGGTVTFADAMDETLALPEARDTIRDLVMRTAVDCGREVKIGYEVRSVAAIKSLVARGAAAGILPLGAVIEEVREGKLDARPIVAPTLRRTLCLASPRKRPRFKLEDALTDVIRSTLGERAGGLGPHTPVPAQIKS